MAVPVKTNSKGQVSVFLAVILLVIVALMAFIINIGIFVKAKINLQNAVDAAAYSGAAVQARQLSNIAYMNWEMRNIYKEWVFKYYVLGQLGLRGTKTPSTSGSMDFRLPSLARLSSRFNTDNDRREDPWNIPSVCIDFAQAGRVCNSYSQPGLPRFDLEGLPGTDETITAFLDALAEQKAGDCATRSNLNFSVATQWTYGMGRDSAVPLPPGVPYVSIDRKGAFPRALEAALRVRNLERMVNESPKGGVTFNPGNSFCQQGGGCRDVREFEGESSPIHERTIKAFWAGFRNLAKSPDSEPNNLKGTFTLTELAPNPYDVDFSTDLGGYLMASAGAGTSNFSNKYYLDLQLQLVNYAIFFNLLQALSTADGRRRNVPNQGQSAACGVRKAAIPVPGYPLGFVKNPDVLTYYAVKGEAHFTGLMNPFMDPIPMVAYGAAKPYGGRIGPHLFELGSNRQMLRPRGKLSFNYITGIQLGGVNVNSITPNDPRFLSLPIPADENFWVGGGTSDVVGGIPAATGEEIKFAIPNMPLDFVAGSPSGFTLPAGNNAYQAVGEYPQPSPGSNPLPVLETAGLYSKAQFFRFKLPILNSGTVGRVEIEQAIAHVLRPTAYEAANYLIPTMEKHNEKLRLQSIGPIPTIDGDGSEGTVDNPHVHYPYAPLYGPGLLFQNVDELEGVIGRYLSFNEGAIDLYLKALKRVAVTMAGADVANRVDIYREAGKLFHSAAGRVNTSDQVILQSLINDDTILRDSTCESIAGKFTYLYLGTLRTSGTNTVQCPRYLKEALMEDWRNRANGGGFQNFFTARYVNPEDVNFSDGDGAEKYMTGYLPGERHGARRDSGESVTSLYNSLVGGDHIHRRNHYSVKFVPLKSLLGPGDPRSYQQGTFSLLVEDAAGVNARGSLSTSFRNPLESAGELRDVNH